jgi:hypothetical protein
MALLHQQLEAVGKTTSGIRVEVTDLHEFEDYLFVTVAFERHPGDFSEESPGVSCIIRPRGGNISTLVGFYPNWRKYGEGTRFTQKETKGYGLRPDKIPAIAADIMNRCVKMLMANANHDPDSYTAAHHAAAWDAIKRAEGR